VVVKAPAPVVGCWDRLRIEQVVTNLVSNAIKYGEGRPVQIRVSCKGSSATLVVSDQGIGIAEADVERIFKQFERATHRRAIGGLGMGLFISQQIVTAHGGTIDVRSAQGRGSAFSVRLPLKPLNADSQSPQSERGRSADGSD
jgi:signal transduction histidine kinase